MVFHTGDQPSASTTLHGEDLIVHCYVETLLTRSVREIDSEDNIEDQFDQTVDFYFIIHTQPIPGLCQKFLCDNMDEINLVFHCWLFQDAPFDPEATFIDHLDMGIFEPQGVQPVHQNLLDSGIEFGATSHRCVINTQMCSNFVNAITGLYAYMEEGFHRRTHNYNCYTTVTYTLSIAWQSAQVGVWSHFTCYQHMRNQNKA